MRNHLLIGAALACLAGCSSGPAEILEGPRYPADLPRAETLDVQVFKEEQSVRMTNTSARAFGPSTIWLNERYGRPIDGWAVGEPLDLRLDEFRDHYSEPFRPGGFFASEKPMVLVLAQVETEGAEGREMVGLVVVETGRPR